MNEKTKLRFLNIGSNTQKTCYELLVFHISLRMKEKIQDNTCASFFMFDANQG